MDYTGQTTNAFEMPPEAPEEDRAAIDALREGTKVRADKVEKTLKKAAKKGLESIDIAGNALDPKVAYANLLEMYDILKSKGITVRKKDMYFSQFPNADEMGEAVGDDIHMNSIILMHPAMRGAHVITHEKAHAKGDVPNEALAEAETRTFGFTDEHGELTPEYQEALKGLYGMVLDMGGDFDNTIHRLYAHYYKAKYDGNFESLYQYVMKGRENKLKTEEARDAADETFWRVFPELTFDPKGQTVVKKADLAKLKVEQVAEETSDEAMNQLQA